MLDELLIKRVIRRAAKRNDLKTADWKDILKNREFVFLFTKFASRLLLKPKV